MKRIMFRAVCLFYFNPEESQDEQLNKVREIESCGYTVYHRNGARWINQVPESCDCVGGYVPECMQGMPTWDFHLDLMGEETAKEAKPAFEVDETEKETVKTEEEPAKGWKNSKQS